MKEHVIRALSQLGKGKYKLGAGGIDPHATSPFNVNRECDCSGFVCWCLGISRKTTHPLYVAFNGGWINTDAIVHDAQMPTGLFYEVGHVLAGDLIVFPGKKRKVGHVGILTNLSTVVHCSKGNMNTFGYAVAKTDDGIFDSNPDTIYVRLAGQ